MVTVRRRPSLTTTTPSSFFEQPDPELLHLARAVNQRTRAGRITFFGTRFEDGVRWSAIFQDGSKRVTINLHGRPSEEDADGIIVALEAWAGFRDEGSPYTTEVPKPPIDSQWS